MPRTKKMKFYQQFLYEVRDLILRIETGGPDNQWDAYTNDDWIADKKKLRELLSKGASHFCELPKKP